MSIRANSEIVILREITISLGPKFSSGDILYIPRSLYYVFWNTSRDMLRELFRVLHITQKNLLAASIVFRSEDSILHKRQGWFHSSSLVFRDAASHKNTHQFLVSVHCLYAIYTSQNIFLVFLDQFSLRRTNAWIYIIVTITT